MLQRLAQFVISTDFNWIFSVSIAVFGLLIYINLVLRSRSMHRDLDRALKAIRGARDQAAFARSFETIDASLRAIPSLKRAWSEFRETLVFPPVADHNPVIRNSVEPSRFFNPASVIGGALDMRFYNSVPNWLTGLGIFGTFLGLFAGIYLAQDGLDPRKDMKLVLEALQRLLGGAALAFLTSIFGLASSLAFAVAERPLVRRLQNRVTDLAQELEARLKWTTAEQFAAEQLAEAKTQTKHLERFNTELVFSLEKALEEKVANRLTDSLKILIEAVEKISNDRTDTNQKALERLAANFQETLTQSTRSEFEALSHTLSGLNTTLASSSQVMQSGQNELQEAAKLIAATVSETLDKSGLALQDGLEKSLNRLLSRMDESSRKMSEGLETAGDQAAARLDGSTKGFVDAVDGLTDVASGLNNLLMSVSSSVQGLQAISASLNQSYERIRSAATPLALTAQEQAKAAEAARLATEKAAHLAAQMGSSIEQLKAIHEETKQSWTDYGERFEDIDGALQKAFGAMDDGLRKFTERVTQFMVEMDKNLAKALQELAAGVGSLEAEVETLNEIAEGMRGVRR
jgi:translation initiation factor 2B subunit (eIF-2B alpha/beta/delta family)